MGFENIEQWRKEFRRLQECRNALDGGDLHAAFSAPRPNLENYVKALISQFGEQRLNMVLGHTVRDKDWDGRFDSRVKAWAANQPPFEQPPRAPDRDAPPRDFCELVANGHSTIINEVCRVKMRMEQEKTKNNVNRGDAR